VRSYSHIAYGETLRLLWTHDLVVSRPRLPGLLATSDGRRITVEKELTSRRWLTPKGTGKKENEIVEIEWDAVGRASFREWQGWAHNTLYSPDAPRQGELSWGR
jgi:hypothetical protein